MIRPEINTIRPVKIRSLITGEVVQRNCAPSRDEVTADGAIPCPCNPKMNLDNPCGALVPANRRFGLTRQQTARIWLWGVTVGGGVGQGLDHDRHLNEGRPCTSSTPAELTHVDSNVDL